MPPIIHVIRHAQALHNVNQDPELTEEGIEQCKIAYAKYWHEEGDKPVAILASPLKRTIQTALNLFPWHTASGKKVILVPDPQEIGDTPSDTGSSREYLESKFGDTLDYDLLTLDWADKMDKALFSEESTKERARLTRVFIRSIAQRHRDEDVNIVVVTHGKYLWHLTKDSDWFENVERRIFVFDSLTEESPEVDLIETPESRY